jgi:hypothetical protein
MPRRTAWEMDNPYNVPEARIAAAPSQGFSLRNAVAAFLAGGILVPASIFAGARVLLGVRADGAAGSPGFWTFIFVASLIGATTAGRFQRFPVFTAVVVGVAIVVAMSILAVIAIVAWAFATGIV